MQHVPLVEQGDSHRRRRAVRRTALILAALALVFYFGIMLLLASA